MSRPTSAATAYEVSDGRGATGSALLTRADRVGIAAWRAWGMTEAPTICMRSQATPLTGELTSTAVLNQNHKSSLSTRPAWRCPPAARVTCCCVAPADDGICARRRRDDTSWWLAGHRRRGHAGLRWMGKNHRADQRHRRSRRKKFSAREIENTLCDHPAIEAAAVLGVPEQRLGEQVVAYVTTRPGQCYPGLSAIIDSCGSAAWHRRNTPWPSPCSRPYR